MKTLKLFIADDHEIMRMGLRTLLETQLGWTIVGEAVNGEEAVEMILELKPDIALIDISMPKLSGLDAARRLAEQGCRTKILILSAHDSSQVIADVLDSGAKGYVLKSEAARDLVAAVDAIRANHTFFTPKVADVVLERHMKRLTDLASRQADGEKKAHT